MAQPKLTHRINKTSAANPPKMERSAAPFKPPFIILSVKGSFIQLSEIIYLYSFPLLFLLSGTIVAKDSNDFYKKGGGLT
jgi:hypothetical protein